jgi:16S rRNA (cytidine1402-2'-O)-methyltransferase
MGKGSVYLIPLPIHNEDEFNEDLIPPIVLKTINKLNYFVVENIRTSRRFIKKINPSFNIDSCKFIVLNKKSDKSIIKDIVVDLQSGISVGVMSEAGCPGIADPGQELCNLAHSNEINIKPLIGPSSIILALMSSGLNGQNFSFHGYLPIQKEDRIKQIKQICKLNGSHIFIETPYRNQQLLNDLIENVRPLNKKISVATNITGKSEKIITKTVTLWANFNMNIKKQPTIFIIE